MHYLQEWWEHRAKERYRKFWQSKRGWSQIIIPLKVTVIIKGPSLLLLCDLPRAMVFFFSCGFHCALTSSFSLWLKVIKTTKGKTFSHRNIYLLMNDKKPLLSAGIIREPQKKKKSYIIKKSKISFFSYSIITALCQYRLHLEWGMTHCSLILTSSPSQLSGTSDNAQKTNL